LGFDPDIAHPCSWPASFKEYQEFWLKEANRCSVFLDIAKAFDTVWIDGLLYKLTILNFPSYLIYIISSYPRGWTFEAPFQTATSSHRGMLAGVE
jgi:hypothetical protein